MAALCEVHDDYKGVLSSLCWVKALDRAVGTLSDGRMMRINSLLCKAPSHNYHIWTGSLMGKTSKVIGRFIKNLSVILVVIAVCLLVLEAAARVGLYVYTGESYHLTRWQGFTAIKNVELKMVQHGKGEGKYYKGVSDLKFKSVGGDAVKYNSKGFRTPEFADTPDKIRLACFGGSSTFGAGSDDHQTWPAFLQRHLDQANPGRYEVINCGFGSYDTGLIKNLLHSEVFGYQPHAVVIYSGFNDHTGGQTTVFKNSPAMMMAAFNLKNALHSKSGLVDVMVRMSANISSQNPKTILKAGDDIMARYQRNLEAIIDACAQRGIPVVLVKQPLDIMNDAPSSAPTGKSFAQAFVKDGRFNDQTFQDIKKAVTENQPRAFNGRTYYFQYLVYREIDAIASLGKSNLYVIDFVNEFIDAGGQGGLFLDVVHLSPAGNDLLAREMLASPAFAQALAQAERCRDAEPSLH